VLCLLIGQDAPNCFVTLSRLLYLFIDIGLAMISIILNDFLLAEIGIVVLMHAITINDLLLVAIDTGVLQASGTVRLTAKSWDVSSSNLLEIHLLIVSPGSKSRVLSLQILLQSAGFLGLCDDLFASIAESGVNRTSQVCSSRHIRLVGYRVDGDRVRQTGESRRDLGIGSGFESDFCEVGRIQLLGSEIIEGIWLRSLSAVDAFSILLGVYTSGNPSLSFISLSSNFDVSNSFVD
jgi:hypothetical protein